MGKLSVLSSKEVVRGLEELGWVLRRQVGSHQVFTKHDSPLTIAVPVRREMPAGTLRRIIRDSGVDVDTLVKAAQG